MNDSESEGVGRAVADRGDQRLSMKALLAEVISIVVGVLLALALSQWSEERSNQTQAGIALDNVAAEIRQNKKLLTVIHDNNLATLQAMRDERDSEDESGRDFIPGLQLRQTAWSAFLSTGLSNYVGYDKVLVLSEMYAIQSVYKQTGMQLVESTMATSAYAAVLEKDIDNNEYQKHFGPYFELLSAIETQLLLAYDGALADIETRN